MDFLRRAVQYVAPSSGNGYQPRLLRRPWLLFFLAVILGTEGFLVAGLVARQTNDNFLAAVVPAEIVALTNTQRSQNNVGPLTENKLLDQAAQAKAQDMAAKDYFSHTGPDGKTPWQWITATGYQYQYAGENLAVRFVASNDVVAAWMASPTHRANMVKPVYTNIGVGVAEGLFEGQPATYVVQYFGTPEFAASPAAAAEAPLSLTQTFMRQLSRAFAEPAQVSNSILAVVAALLLLALVLTVVVHAHIQPARMLARGAVVAGLAVLFLLLNLNINLAIAPEGQPASVAASAAGVASQGVDIGGSGASVEFALFPH